MPGEFYRWPDWLVPLLGRLLAWFWPPAIRGQVSSEPSAMPRSGRCVIEPLVDGEPEPPDIEVRR